MEALLRFLAGLIPKHGADAEEHYRYMLRLGLTVSALVVALVAMVSIDNGWVGAEGFARQSAFVEVVGEIRANRSQELRAQLLTLQTKACQTKNDEARSLYVRLIGEAADEYDFLNPQHPYTALACAQL